MDSEPPALRRLSITWISATQRSTPASTERLWQPNALIVGEDRVAIVHIAWGILDKKRVTDAARSTAVRDLGKTADPAEIDAKAAAIKSSKCVEAESLTLKDLRTIKESGLTADETTVENLGRAQVGLKKYEEVENRSTTFSKFRHPAEARSPTCRHPRTPGSARSTRVLAKYPRKSKPLTWLLSSMRHRPAGTSKVRH